MRRLGRYKEAIECFDRALKINPMTKRAWNNKGLVLEKMGRYDEALLCYENALKIDPDYHRNSKIRAFKARR